MFYVQGNYALSGLRVRGVSAIQGFLMYTSNGSSIGTLLLFLMQQNTGYMIIYVIDTVDTS